MTVAAEVSIPAFRALAHLAKMQRVDAELLSGAGSRAHDQHLARLADAYRALNGWFASAGGTTP